MIIRMTFGGTDARLQASMQRRGPRVMEAITSTLDGLMLELQKRIQRKLSGEVLQHRSGKLLASIVKLPTVVSGSKISGGVTGAGGPAFYGRIQESGGTRTYDIYPRFKKALAFFPGGSLGAGGGIVQVRKDIIRNLYARSGKNRGSLKPGQFGNFGQLGGIVVKHVVHPPLPPRPFMRPSLEEMQQEIINRLQRSVSAAMRGTA